jgi:hypothetical protein
MSVRIEYLLGTNEEPVVVEVSTRGSRTQPLDALMHLTLETAVRRRPRFPIVIERGKARIAVDGRKRVFTTYTCGQAAVAVASLGDLDVMIRCPAKRFSALSLEAIDAADLKKELRGR